MRSIIINFCLIMGLVFLGACSSRDGQPLVEGSQELPLETESSEKKEKKSDRSNSKKVRKKKKTKRYSIHDYDAAVAASIQKSKKKNKEIWDAELLPVSFEVFRPSKTSNRISVVIGFGEIPNFDPESETVLKVSEVMRSLKSHYKVYKKTAELSVLKPDELKFKMEWLYGEGVESQLIDQKTNEPIDLALCHDCGELFDCHSSEENEGQFTYEFDESIQSTSGLKFLQFSCHYHGKKMSCHFRDGESGSQ